MMVLAHWVPDEPHLFFLCIKYLQRTFEQRNAHTHIYICIHTLHVWHWHVIWFIWWFICVLPLVTIDIGPIGVRTSWKPKTNPLKPVWWAKSSWLHHGCFDSHVSIIWCVIYIYICHIHSLISLYIYIYLYDITISWGLCHHVLRFCRLIRLIRMVKVFRIRIMRDLRLMVKGRRFLLSWCLTPGTWDLFM